MASLIVSASRCTAAIVCVAIGVCKRAKPAQLAPLFDAAVEFGAHIPAAVKEQYGKPRRASAQDARAPEFRVRSQGAPRCERCCAAQILDRVKHRIPLKTLPEVPRDETQPFDDRDEPEHRRDGAHRRRTRTAATPFNAGTGDNAKVAGIVRR